MEVWKIVLVAIIRSHACVSAADDSTGTNGMERTVKVNVGGTLREMHHSTAQRIPFLAANLEMMAGGQEPIFVDASPAAFDVLLELARGRSLQYFRQLDPALRTLVEEYAEQLGMECALGSECERTDAFSFSLTAELPSNKSVVNRFSHITHGGARCTTGMRPQWNTVFGDAQVPQAGPVYWEVEVVSFGSVGGGNFLIGVVDAKFPDAAFNLFQDGDLGLGIGCWRTAQTSECNVKGEDVSQHFPISNGVRIGVLVDVSRGSLMFFFNGAFKVSHPANVRARSLYPALSIYSDTQLAIKTGLPPPS